MKKITIITTFFYLTVFGNITLQAQWVKQVSYVYDVLNSVHCINDNVCYTVGDNGERLKTTNGGLSWINIKWFGDNNLKSVYAKKDTVAFTTGLFIGVTALIPGKEIWGGPSNLPFSTQNLMGRCIYYINNNTGYLAGDSGVIIKSDTGLMNTNNWFLEQTETTHNLYSVRFSSDSTGYAAGDSGTILKTTNGGKKWIKLNAGIGNNFKSVYFINDSTGFVVGSKGIIFKTNDGGKSWEAKQSNTSYGLNSINFPSDSIGYIAGDGGIILRSSDTGNTWIKQVSGVSYNLMSVFFTNTQNGYAVGAYGTILKTKNGGIIENAESYTGKENTIRVYPNPAKEYITIEKSDPKAQNYIVSLKNIEGQEVLLTNIKLTDSFKLNLSNLTNGIYFLILKNDKENYVKKVVVQ